MGILDSLLSGQNGQLIAQLARSSGIGEKDVQNVLGQLLPAVSKGIKGNASSSEGLGELVTALGKGNYQRYLESPEELAGQAATDEGNAILGKVLGGRDASRGVAEQAAKTTGIDSSIIKQLLPLVATMAMGALSKETTDSPIGGRGQSLDMSSLTGADASPVIGKYLRKINLTKKGVIINNYFADSKCLCSI